MTTVISGRLVSSAFVRDILPALDVFAEPPGPAARALERWGDRVSDTLGPASSLRAIVDGGVAPLFAILGFDAVARQDGTSVTTLHLGIRGRPLTTLFVTPWAYPLTSTRRSAVADAVRRDARWALACNGQTLRIFDVQRSWMREVLDIDLVAGTQDVVGRRLLWTLVRPAALAGRPPTIEIVAAASASHGARVCQALGDGVLEALSLLVTALRRRRTPVPPRVSFDGSLIVLYRMLFLLFAEARGLVPMWHPVYRDRYSLGTIVTNLLDGRQVRGVWPAVLAISRLAHAGWRGGELTVNAFNGRLFAPAHTVVFDRAPLSDDIAGRALVAIGSTPSPSSSSSTRTSAAPGQRQITRRRIAYRDLDVEQLGAVYERVLDYEPPEDSAAALVHTRDVRKATGAFYTPRPVTAFLVRETLRPLIAGRSSEELLSLRILDPAMGSGAFLVAACRYLSRMAERALIDEGRWHPGDITTDDRTALRRDIASRCLFGVDINPMAVQLARLSLWLATLAADKPLSFLDHHLVSGDSLAGATPDDLRRQPSRGSSRHARDLPLFPDDGLTRSLADAAQRRLRLTLDPDDTAQAVQAKERTLAAIDAAGSARDRWRRALDLWCAGWFWDGERAPDRRVLAALIDVTLTGRSDLPDHLLPPFLERGRAIAGEHRFLHWPLAFPEVFADGGFDAVIGNPPWDVLRGDSGSQLARGLRRDEARGMTAFARDSGVYRATSGAHVNRYQLFVERSLQLLQRGGRLGLIVPSGLASDTATAPLRRYLFDHARVDTLTGVDNRDGIFPIHRSVRFALVTATTGARTDSIACRFGLSRLDELESSAGRHAPLVLTRRFLARVSGEDDLGIPELATADDVRVVESIVATVPRLGDAAGWGAVFGRELNATDDRGLFAPRSSSTNARAVVEGKHIEPFRTSVASAIREVRDEDVSNRIPRRSRLAYRDVASATNRLTLIAAILPADVVSTHTLFCLRTPLPLDDQHALCTLLNSFVANYLMRLRVHTHVTATLMSRLPVPRAHGALLRGMRVAAQRLSQGTTAVEAMEDYVEAQVLAAKAYGIAPRMLERVLETFPLVSARVREEVLRRFEGRLRGDI